MKKIHIVGLALFAVFAFSAIAATSASATGPWWIVLLGTELHHLVWAEEEKLTTEADGVLPVLEGTLATIDCAAVKIQAGGTGYILGGNPGTDLTDLEFTGCHVETLPNCLAGNLPVGATLDTIDVSVLTVLVYPDPENKELALDAFFPDNETSPGSANDLFVDFTLKNASGFTECGLLAGQLVEVLADGTEVTDVGETGHTVLFDKRCGVLAEVGRLNGGAFEKTLSGEEFEIGALNFPEPILEAIILNANVSLIECSLLVFNEPAKQLGIANITLESKNLFGWEEK